MSTTQSETDSETLTGTVFPTKEAAEEHFETLDVDAMEREMKRCNYTSIMCRSTEPKVYVNSDNRILFRVSRTHGHKKARNAVREIAEKHGFKKAEEQHAGRTIWALETED